MAEPPRDDPNDFYALLDDIEGAAMNARRIGNDERETVIARLEEIRRKSGGAKDEDLISWDGWLRVCLNNMGSPEGPSQTIRELLDSDAENVGVLLVCLDQIQEDM
jgi:hypothetical protein